MSSPLEQRPNRFNLKRAICQRSHQLIERPALFDLRIEPVSVLRFSLQHDRHAMVPDAAGLFVRLAFIAACIGTDGTPGIARHDSPNPRPGEPVAKMRRAAWADPGAWTAPAVDFDDVSAVGDQ